MVQGAPPPRGAFPAHQLSLLRCAATTPGVSPGIPRGLRGFLASPHGQAPQALPTKTKVEWRFGFQTPPACPQPSHSGGLKTARQNRKEGVGL